MKQDFDKDSYFVIEGRLIGINEIINCARNNKFGSAAQKKKEMKRVNDSILIYPIKNKTFNRRVSIEIVAYEPNFRRDVDNIIGGAQKIICDSLVECGVLSDDSQKFVYRVIGEVRVDAKNPRIEVYLTEEE